MIPNEIIQQLAMQQAQKQGSEPSQMSAEEKKRKSAMNFLGEGLMNTGQNWQTAAPQAAPPNPMMQGRNRQMAMLLNQPQR